MSIVIVDDLRYFPDLESEDVTYFRTGTAGMIWLKYYLNSSDRHEVELWLDHDLGGTETIRPLVIELEEYLENVSPVPELAVRIITDNPAGRRWMEQALSGRVRVLPPPDLKWRIVVEMEER